MAAAWSPQRTVACFTRWITAFMAWGLLLTTLPRQGGGGDGKETISTAPYRSWGWSG